LDVATIVRSTLDRPDDGEAIEFQGHWMRWTEVRSLTHAIEAALIANDVDRFCAVGFVARNRSTHAAVLMGLVADRRPISMIYAFQAAAPLSRDVEQLRPAALIASEDDWSPQLIDAVNSIGAVRISISLQPPFAITVAERARRPAATYHRLPEAGVEILSSGTTGPPRRIFHRSAVLFRSLLSGKAEVENESRSPPDLVFWPLSGIGGVLQVSRAMIKGAAMCVLERFTVEGIVDAVKRHRLRSLALTPTMARMIYDADVPKADFGSLVAFFGGAGPLDVDLEDKLVARYGLPVIWAMGATEFCGSVIAWTADLKQRYGAVKRGSTGRAMVGCELSVRNPDTGAVEPPGVVGKLAVRVPLIGSDWIETTDLVLIDEDGFVFHRGRSDGAIVRGGFKIIPETINAALRLHSGVAEAAVISMPDARLGSVPVAAIVRRAGNATLDADALDAHARTHLHAPEIPVRFHFIDAMPYTASMKVDLASLKKLLEAADVSRPPSE